MKKSDRLRSQVPVEETWDLSALFASQEEFEKAQKEVQKETEAFCEKYKDQMKTKEDVISALKDYAEITEEIGHIMAFSNLRVEVNMMDNELMADFYKARGLISELSAQLSFFENQLLALPEEVLKEAAKDPDYSRYLEQLLQRKEHLLGEEAEKVLSALSGSFDAPFNIYNDIKFSDTQFPNLKLSDREETMTYGSFEGRYETDPDTELRRTAFRVFSDELANHQYGTASAYNAQLLTEKTMATLRGYDSVFDYLLDQQEVSRELYNRQIDVIMKELAPHMRRYAKLLQKIHGLDKMTYADLKLEVDPTYAPSISYEEAQDYIIDGLQILGDEYKEILESAFANRWIDWSENKGKRTGAFCSSPYGCHSYIMCSFSEKMEDVMTLAHELGHAGHFTLAGRNQNIYNTRSSMYFVESPSTTNEILMENYLLDKSDSKRMRRWVLSQMISKTYYHNFVTHFMEAAFQREVYKIIDQGGSVQADLLNKIFREKLEEFWGDAVELTKGAELTWMRQPHYYMGLYPYTYSAGLTIGTQMAKRILKEGDHVAQDWLEVLRMGGSKKPQELAMAAGVDISTEEPLRDTIAYIGSIIDEIISLTEEIENGEM